MGKGTEARRGLLRPGRPGRGIRAAGVPVVVLLFVNSALTAYFAVQRGVTDLREAGARILMGPGTWQPHEPHTGGRQLDTFPWELTLGEADRMSARGCAPTAATRTTAESL